MKRLGELFWAFFRIGSLTFGGGYAMIPLIQKETVEKKKWVSPEDIVDIVAIAESTPGPIAISASTFVGYRIAGVAGATLATIGVIVPSFIIIFVLSFVLYPAVFFRGGTHRASPARRRSKARSGTDA